MFSKILNKEVIRVVLFLLIILIYLTTKIGFVLALLHFFLLLKNSRKYGMSVILNKLITKIFSTLSTQ